MSRKLVAQAGLPADSDFDPEHLMDRPGFKVMHVQDMDYRSNCQPFVACLAEIRAWSHAHPRHLPLYLLIETKQQPLKVIFPSTQPVPLTPALFDALDAEIRSIFAPDEIITPDQVRGSYATLDEAVRAGNWLTLDSAQGKAMFLMDQRKMGPVYLAGHPSLRVEFYSLMQLQVSRMPRLPDRTIARLMLLRLSSSKGIWCEPERMKTPNRLAPTTRLAAMQLWRAVPKF